MWHLGSVTAACLASVGHAVVGIDEDPSVISALEHDQAPVFEEGLDELTARQNSVGTSTVFLPGLRMS